MAAETRTFAARWIKVDGNLIEGAVSAAVQDDYTSVIDPGAAGTSGPAGVAVVNCVKTVGIFSMNREALRELIGQPKADVQVGLVGVDGATMIRQFTNVVFNQAPSEYQIQAKDGGGKVSVWGIKGLVLFGPAETESDVETEFAES